ncbi:MAG TPA: hypothetical protein VM925_33125 [Labilithrix sp.]|nr:hypothetical protein [Labilithrix sp.]
MKIIVAFALFASLSVASVACSKSETSTTGTTAASAAPSPKAASAPAFVQKGIPGGKVVVGYIQDNQDESQCSAVVDAPEKKENFTKNADKVAAMFKGKVVSSCPTGNVVGTCSAGFGMLVNYSGPKWTTETAKKDCTSHATATWVD